MEIPAVLENTIDVNTIISFNKLINYIVLDEECRIVKVSEEICQLLSYNENELISKEIGELLSNSDDMQRETLKKEIIQQDFTCHKGILLVNKVGRFITSDLYVYQRFLPNNMKVYVALIMGDLNYQAELENKYLEKSLELNTFIYRTSHDLRGPLCTLSGLMEIVREEIKEHSATDLIELVETTINKLDYTLSNLVNVAEANAGIVNKPADIDIQTLLYRIVGKVGESYNIYDNLFCIDIEQDGYFINHENLFSSILFNLITNALQNLVPDRIGIINIKIRQHSDKSVILMIEDNGQGIPLEIQGRVFDMFFKGNAQGKSGLGLYMVKNYAEYMGGSIELESAPGVGTTVKLHIPSLKVFEN